MMILFQVLSELDICSYYLLTGRLAGHEKRRWCFREERERSDAKLGLNSQFDPLALLALTKLS
jgi:hypothetical protein